MCISAKRTKIIIGLIVSLALIVLAYIYSFFTNSGERLNYCVVSEKQYEEILASRDASSSLISSLVFNDQYLAYDSINDFYLYSLVDGSVEPYNPSVRVVSGNGDMKIRFCCDKITSDMIENNRSIPFVVYDDKQYEEGVLRLTTLPIMCIRTSGTIPDSKEESVDMQMELFDNRAEASRKILSSDGKIKVRGNTTLVYPKKSYKLSLTRATPTNSEKKNKISLLGMPSDEDWILTAMYEDPEKIRDVFCARLWKESLACDNSEGLDLGTEYKYIEVFINDEYFGLYALGYKLRNEQLGIKNNDNNTALFFKRDYAHFDAMYLDDQGIPYRYEIESSDDNDLFSMLTDAMVNSELIKEDVDRLYSMVDVDNLAGYYLFLNLIQGKDNIDNNQYILMKRDRDGNVKILYSVWDMNYSWGRSYGTNYGYSPDEMFLYDYGFLQHLILLDVDRFKNALKEKYFELRKTTWSDEAISKMIDDCEYDVYSSGAYLRERERWPDYANGSWCDLSRFRDYVNQRFAVMDKYIENPEVSLSDDCTEFFFGSREAFEAARKLYFDDSDVRVLQVKNKELWDYSYYLRVMNNLSIPEELIMTELSLRDQLCRFGDTADYWQLSVDTDIIVLVDGQMQSATGFFDGDSTVETSYGELSYKQDEAGNGILMLDNDEILSDSPSDEPFAMRYIQIDASGKSVRELAKW